MTRSTMPILICDHEDGCGDVVSDFYEQCASSVDGVRVTLSQRAPGWRSNEHEDFCPEHAADVEIGRRDA